MANSVTYITENGEYKKIYTVQEVEISAKALSSSGEDNYEKKNNYIVEDKGPRKEYVRKEVEIFTKLDVYRYSESLLQASYLGDLYNTNFIISEDSYFERYRYNTLTKTAKVTKHPIVDGGDILTYAINLNAEDLAVPVNQNEFWSIYGTGSAKPANGEIIGIDSSSYINLSYIIWDGVKFLVNEENTDLIITEQQ